LIYIRAYLLRQSVFAGLGFGVGLIVENTDIEAVFENEV
jgi:hypothetical protein